MIVYGRSNGKALRSALNSVTEVRNGYIYAAATGERIAKITVISLWCCRQMQTTPTVLMIM